MIDPSDKSLIWLLILGYAVAIFFALCIGSNNVANNFGTSIGSGVLTYKQVGILAMFIEVIGAVLIGYKVSFLH